MHDIATTDNISSVTVNSFLTIPTVTGESCQIDSYRYFEFTFIIYKQINFSNEGGGGEIIDSKKGYFMKGHNKPKPNEAHTNQLNARYCNN